jgi:hypothetical protein
MTSGVAAACPKCRSALPGAMCNTPAPVRCPACDAMIQVEVFPAHFLPATTGQSAEPIIEEGVSSCFYHEQKKAVTHCDACGRFLCALCDVEFNGQHICPACLQSGKQKGRLPHLESSRAVWDSAALFICLAPVITVVLSPVVIGTAPIAIGVAIVSFFKPGSIVPRTRIRAWLAIVLSLLEIAVWVYFFFPAD